MNTNCSAHKSCFASQEISDIQHLTTIQEIRGEARDDVRTFTVKKWMLTLLLVILPIGFAQADCDLKKFPWGCDIPVNVMDQAQLSSLIYCDNIRVYVTKAQYDLITRYQKSNVDMNLLVNGDFFGGPCVPAKRYASYPSTL